MAKIKYRVEWKDAKSRCGERWVAAYTPDDVAGVLSKLMGRSVDILVIRLPYVPSIWAMGRVAKVVGRLAEIVAPSCWFMRDRLAGGERRVRSSVTHGYGWRIRRGEIYPVNALPSDVAVGDRVVLVRFGGMCQLGPKRETPAYLSWIEEQEPFVNRRLIQRGTRARRAG